MNLSWPKYASIASKKTLQFIGGLNLSGILAVGSLSTLDSSSILCTWTLGCYGSCFYSYLQSLSKKYPKAYSNEYFLDCERDRYIGSHTIGLRRSGKFFFLIRGLTLHVPVACIINDGLLSIWCKANKSASNCIATCCSAWLLMPCCFHIKQMKTKGIKK